MPEHRPSEHKIPAEHTNIANGKSSSKALREQQDGNMKADHEFFGPEDAAYQAFLAQRATSNHPERFELGKPHPDRAKQFKPFAALRGYEALVDQAIRAANESHDFTELEESC